MAEVSWTYEKMSTTAGNEITYAVVLPDGFDAGKEYTMLLALPPGRQNKDMVEYVLKAQWASGGHQRNWIVISPIAPSDGFVGGSNMKDFYAHLMEKYKVKDKKLHLTGISNGGMSSFRLALKHPDYFKSITVLPGFSKDFDQFEKIKHLPINLFVGENDTDWVGPMKEMEEKLEAVGAKVNWNVLPGEGHELKSLYNNSKVFDAIEGKLAKHHQGQPAK